MRFCLRVLFGLRDELAIQINVDARGIHGEHDVAGVRQETERVFGGFAGMDGHGVLERVVAVVGDPHAVGPGLDGVAFVRCGAVVDAVDEERCAGGLTVERQGAGEHFEGDVHVGGLVAPDGHDLLVGLVALFHETNLVLALFERLPERRGAVGLAVDLDFGEIGLGEDRQRADVVQERHLDHDRAGVLDFPRDVLARVALHLDRCRVGAERKIGQDHGSVADLLAVHRDMRAGGLGVDHDHGVLGDELGVDVDLTAGHDVGGDPCGLVAVHREFYDIHGGRDGFGDVRRDADVLAEDGDLRAGGIGGDIHAAVVAGVGRGDLLTAGGQEHESGRENEERADSRKDITLGHVHLFLMDSFCSIRSLDSRMA